MLELICCNKIDADYYYKHLLRQKVHFAIIFINEGIKSFIEKFADSEIFYYHGENGGETDKDCKKNHLYNMAFLVQTASIISHSVILKYENKLHKKIPNGYEYCFSYHKKDPFFRSWPVYLRREQKIKSVMFINPYEKETDNLIVLPLYFLKAKLLMEQGYTIEFYHYFPIAFELAKCILDGFQNSPFPMKESDVSLEELHTNLIVEKMKNMQLISLENVLAVSKELKLKEVSNYLGIASIFKRIDPISWRINNISDKSAQYPIGNIVICLDGLDILGQRYQELFYKFESICDANELNIVKVSREGAIYKVVGGNRMIAFDSIFSFISCFSIYIGTDFTLAHVAGMLNITNLMILNNIEKYYNPPLRKHTILKTGSIIEEILPENLYDLIMEIHKENNKNHLEVVDIECYGRYPIIEI